MCEKTAQRLSELLRQIDYEVSRSNRPTGSVTLLGVSKTQPVASIVSAVLAGLRHIGENRVQEALSKKPLVESALQDVGFDTEKLCWHFIGKLQSNKINKIAAEFDVVETIDSSDIAKRLNDACCRLGKVRQVLIEVNISGETTKGGVAPHQTFELAQKFDNLPNLDLCGLMTIGPLTDDRDAIQKAFERMRDLRDDLQQRMKLIKTLDLSMGMSDDYPIAIAAGATLIRIGTALFGPRNT